MRLIFLSYLLVYATIGNSQVPPAPTASTFEEVKTATLEHIDLWHRDLYGPILLVNPDTRDIYANVADSAGALHKTGTIYTGKLPETINIANTSMTWSGKKWAMIILPLPDDYFARVNLMTHELFHLAQPSMGFKAHNILNDHLDEKDGRIYLRLELEALKQAVQTTNADSLKKILTDAFTFRKYRNLLFPESADHENGLELNEGLAEYTGEMMSGRDQDQATRHFLSSIEDFLSNPTFIRSFAYQTIPVYGYLLHRIEPAWNLEVSDTTNLANFFIKAFGIGLPHDLKKASDAVSDRYHGLVITREENAREAQRQKRLAQYKSEFVASPHLYLPFMNMHIAFDPRNLVPLEDLGTVYPNLRISDAWGILTAKNGALVGAHWDGVTVSAPTNTDGNEISGDGWTLELNDGFQLIKNDNGNYKLVKK